MSTEATIVKRWHRGWPGYYEAVDSVGDVVGTATHDRSGWWFWTASDDRGRDFSGKAATYGIAKEVVAMNQLKMSDPVGYCAKHPNVDCRYCGAHPGTYPLGRGAVGFGEAKPWCQMCGHFLPPAKADCADCLRTEQEVLTH